MLSPAGIGAEIQGRVEEVYDTLFTEAQKRTILEPSSSGTRVLQPQAAAAEELNGLPYSLPVIGNGLMPAATAAAAAAAAATAAVAGRESDGRFPPPGPNAKCSDNAKKKAGSKGDGKGNLGEVASGDHGGTREDDGRQGGMKEGGGAKATVGREGTDGQEATVGGRVDRQGRLKLPGSMSQGASEGNEREGERERHAVHAGDRRSVTSGEEGHSGGVKAPIREGGRRQDDGEMSERIHGGRRKAMGSGLPRHERKAGGSGFSKQPAQEQAEPKRVRRDEGKREAVIRVVSALERGGEIRAAKDSPSPSVTVSAWDLGAKGSLAGVIIEREMEPGVADGPCAIQLLLGGGIGVSSRARGIAAADAPAVPAAPGASTGTSVGASRLGGAVSSTPTGAKQALKENSGGSRAEARERRESERGEGGVAGTKRRAEHDVPEREGRVRKVGGDSGLDAISLLTRPGLGMGSNIDGGHIGPTTAGQRLVGGGGSNVVARDADGFRVPRAIDNVRREGKGQVSGGSADKGILGKAPSSLSAGDNDPVNVSGGGFSGQESKVPGEGAVQGGSEVAALQILQIQTKKA